MREDVGKRNQHHRFLSEVQHHFITRKDVINLNRKLNHLSKIHHENDAQSVDQMVKELQQESYDPILCYKQQGKLDPAYPHAFLLQIFRNHFTNNFLQ